MTDFTLQITGGDPHLIGFETKLIESVYAETDTLGEMERDRVKERVLYYRSGALQTSISYEANHDPSDPMLVRIYAAAENQYDQYGRYYAQFIEGEPLGRTSPTISRPSEMFEKIYTEDTQDIKMWTYYALEQGKQRYISGSG